MMSSEQDPNFLALSKSLKQSIDAAFDAAISGDTDSDPAADEPLRKKRRIAADDFNSELLAPEPGGFIIDDNYDLEPGGFLTDSPPVAGAPSHSPSPSRASPLSLSQPTQIPLSVIPTALARLNLAPDDEDVLAVFRNAASGWSVSHQPESQNEGVVSRKDFRAVCAVLLDSGSPPSHSLLSAAPMVEAGGFLIEDEGEGGRFIPAASDLSLSRNPDFAFDDSGDESDAYQEPEYDPDEDDGSVDEYLEGRNGPSSRRSKPTRKSRRRFSGDETVEDFSPKHKPPSSRQKKEARLAFGLFFPDVVDNKLDEQRITIKDIIRIAGLLKEKIKAEEVCIFIRCGVCPFAFAF